MMTYTHILAAGDNGTELFYIIAVLILGAVGAIVEKLKQKMGRRDETPQGRRPAPRGDDQVTHVPRPQPPQVRPAPPVGTPAARRLPSQPMAPARRPAPPVPSRPPEARRPTRVETPAAPPAGHKLTQVAQPRVPTTVQVGESAPRPPAPLARGAAAPAAPGGAATEPTAALGLGSFRNLAMADIRRAIVLNEVLGLPLALRSAEQLWDRS